MRRALLMIVAACVSGCGKDSTDGPIVPGNGQTWWMNLDTMEVLEPAEAGGLLDLVSGDYPLLVSSINVTDSSFSFLFALAHEDGSQDLCSRTITMDEIALNEDGSFAFGPADFTLPNGALTEDLTLNGTFSRGLGTITDISMTGSIRVTSIPEDVLPLGGIDVCELIGTIDIECGDCRDGATECLDMHMVGVTGSLRDGVSVDAISEADSFDECIEDTGTP